MITGKLLTACFTEHLFLPIQFIEGIRFKHDAFPVMAVVKSKQVPDFVSTFFCYPVNKIVVVPASSIIFVTEPCSRDYCCTNRFTGKSEYKTVAVFKKVLVNNQEERFLYGMAVLICLDAV